KELNHYQLHGTAWEQRLPGFDAPCRMQGRPYDIVRVMMPGGPAGEDIKGLNCMIAQYLSAAVGPAGFGIAASDVDAQGKLQGGEQTGFRCPLFSTRGAAALEYPGEHIQRACPRRLQAETFNRWLRHPHDGDGFQRALRLPGGLELEPLLQRLTEGAVRIS